MKQPYATTPLNQENAATRQAKPKTSVVAFLLAYSKSLEVKTTTRGNKLSLLLN